LNMARIGSKPIEFNLHIGCDVPAELLGDELRIKQILNNLLSNAFKYTQEGNVDLSVSAEYGTKEGDSDVVIVFRVKDTGQGMEEWQVRMLFNEYSRFDMASNRKVEGTGLGMNIAQHLINMMNGEISVESEPGKGSLFTVRLPQGRIGDKILDKELAHTLLWLSNVAAPRAKATQIVREPMPYGRVLIVDDLEINLYVAKGLLTPYDLSIDTVLSGFEAIDKVRGGEEYDIVFMDHMMPKMDGIETTKMLRDMGYTRAIVALTANALVGQAEMFLENGFDGFLSKPVDLRQMNSVLNKFIRDKQPPEMIEAARKQHVGDKTSETSIEPRLARIFVSDAEKAITALGSIFSNRFRRDDDLKIFVVNAHAMKNALLNIGELALANTAYKLELIGKKGNVDVMLAEMPAFLNALQAVTEKMRQKEEE
ncbi:MAG: ATP-binding protein, partial [Syntrophorhabdaceae bacterium]|nr:ATP-binding protein [Syntrophorhabdaceae bacterium]